MFGESEEGKRKKELEKAKEESKKLEEAMEQAPGAGGEGGEAEPAGGKEEKKGGMLAGLSNFASGKKEKGDASKSEERQAGPEEGEAEKPPAEKKEKEAAPAAEEKEEVAEEPAPEPEQEKKKKKPDPEVAKLRKQLERQKESIESAERDKEDALKKREEMASLVEELSDEIKEAKGAPAAPAAAAQPAAPSIEPKLRELEDKTAAQIKELKDAIGAAATKKEEEKKGEEEVAETMKKMFDKRLKELGEKLEEKKEAPPKEEAAAGEVSGGLIAMGGGVEFQKDLDNIKKSMKDLATLFDAFKEEAENRFMAVDKELQPVERVPDLEDKMSHFERKLGPENVQKLRMLISSADDLKEEVIPLIVGRRVEEKIDPLSKKVKDVENALQLESEGRQSIRTDMDMINKDIKALYKFEDRIGKMEEGLAGAMKLLAELRALVRELDKEQKKSTEDRMKEVLPKMIEAESSNIRKEFTGRFAFIDDKLQSVENMVAESHKETSELAVLKGQFDKLEDDLQDVNDELEKISGRLEDLKSRDMDLGERIEALQTPKEIITELDKKTKDILEIRDFFVRRADGLEQRINVLDERAVPTKKLNDRVAAMVRDIKGIRQSQHGLEQRIAKEKNEFHALIRQHAAEKRRLEETIKAQKARVAMLLHELK
jgi:DNA repair exonuclease SbcCD ATPase subunit